MKIFNILVVALMLVMSVQVKGQSPNYMEWVERSANHIDNNNLDSAAISLQRAMRLDPANENNSVLLLNLGIIQRQLRDYDNAYISFTASLANNPIPDIVLHNRASLLVELGKFDEAMEDYNLLIIDFPDDLEAHYRRGLLFLEENNRVKAEADFRKSEEIDPNNMYTKLSKALLFKLDNKWELAEMVYTDLINNETNGDPSFYMNRAECYINNGKTLLASADLRSVELSQSNNPYYFFLRGRVRLDQFDKTAAKADFNKAKSMGYDESIVDEWLKKAE
ncbi:MAG: tetratricopeptide repeat protein [Bacteroidales bacterium]|nr:tetratricopeptide repeat protein [Bacteroidales bacterium]